MVKYLFYLLIALFPLGVLTRISILPALTISLPDLVVGLILILSFPQIVAFVKRRNRYFYIGIMFILISILGNVMHTRNIFEFTISASYLVRLVSYLLLLIPLSYLSRNTVHKLKYELVGAGVVFIMFGYIQYFLYPNLRNLIYLGWDDHLYRLFSTFLDPNFAGTYISLILILFVTLLWEATHKIPRRYTYVTCILGLLLVPSLFLTYSRTSLIAAFIAFLVFLFLLNKKKLIAVFLILFLAAIFLLPKNLGGEGVKLFRTASIFSRVDAYQKTMQVFYDNPFFGVGFDSLRFVSRDYGFVSAKNALVSHSAAGVPNSYIVLLATTGLVGIGLFLIALYDLFKRLILLRSKKSVFVLPAGVLASLTVVLVSSFFENTMLYAPIMVWVVVLLGIVFAEGKSAKDGK